MRGIARGNERSATVVRNATGGWEKEGEASVQLKQS
jgi:hypothetical protein